MTRQGLWYRRQWRDRDCVRVCRCGCGQRFLPRRVDHVFATYRCGSVYWQRLHTISPRLVESAYRQYLANRAAAEFGEAA